MDDRDLVDVDVHAPIDPEATIPNGVPVPQPPGVRAVLADRQIRLHQLPPVISELPVRHNLRSYRIRPPSGSGSARLITTPHRP
ncbi:MAG: hypothetical protein JWL99_3900 [Streptomyces oryziradicis]|nr:hypothetical protein [Actinacidiphila oryziradicis]